MFSVLMVAELVNIAIILPTMDFWLCYQAGFQTDSQDLCILIGWALSYRNSFETPCQISSEVTQWLWLTSFQNQISLLLLDSLQDIPTGPIFKMISITKFFLIWMTKTSLLSDQWEPVGVAIIAYGKSLTVRLAQFRQIETNWDKLSEDSQFKLCNPPIK